MQQNISLETQQRIAHLRQTEKWSLREIANETGVGVATVHKYGDGPVGIGARLELELYSGTVLIGSDAHIWPGEHTTAWQGFCFVAATLKPEICVLNGDFLDGARISRHSSIGWEKRPKLIEELEAVSESLHGLNNCLPKLCKRVWNLGNHDMRFETRLAAMVPEYAGIKGMHLKDHFPGWRPAWSCWINDEVVIKHRFKGGDNATFNNVMRSGKSIVTGHLHSLRVTPYTDYSGTRWGVDCGTLADVGSRQFMDYTEDNPVNWRSGFVVLTFQAGQLLWPEVCYVVEPGKICFRGEVFNV